MPHPALIRADEPPAVEAIAATAAVPLLLVCDHASPRIPLALGRLGLDAAALDRHIAYDIGAAALTRRLTARLGVAAMLAGYSRLVIDCNRDPGEPDAIVEESDGTLVPGNRVLNITQRRAREDAIHQPYHRAIAAALADLAASGPPPVLFSIHTYTPQLGAARRRWDAGVLWNRDPRLGPPLIQALRAVDGLVIGDNEPYSGREIAYTLNRHGGAAGLANAAIEIRQDLCETADQQARWADLLVSAVLEIFGRPGTHAVCHY